MSALSSQLSKFKLELRRVRRALRALPRELEQRERAVLEDADLTTEARRIKLRQIREEEQAKQQKLHQRLIDATSQAKRLEKQIRVLRPVDDAARARVGNMLGDGIAHDQIIEHAAGLGDSETIAALRWEALYHGDKNGFADAAATIEACDRALAQVGRGGEQEDNQAIVDVADAREAVDEINEFAVKSVLGQATPHDRIKLGFAVGPLDAKEDD
jgi:hypothetical protein